MLIMSDKSLSAKKKQKNRIQYRTSNVKQYYLCDNLPEPCVTVYVYMSVGTSQPAFNFMS